MSGPLGQAAIFLGRGVQFLQLPLVGGQTHWSVTTRTQTAAGRTLCELVEDWSPYVLSAINSTPPAEIRKTMLASRRTSLRLSDRVVLAGDAAHPMSPDLGQGACQALEDAVVLTQCLTASPDALGALQEYEFRRRSRVAKVSRQSNRMGEVLRPPGIVMPAARNACLVAVPKGLIREALARTASIRAYQRYCGSELLD
jgi:2-polyprenyl-6-methoxyphenol hydroxylase-like FAD-dependent oxidoreductase